MAAMQVHYPINTLATGAGSGIGQASAIAFCKSGVAKFALLDMNASGLEETHKSLQAINSQVEVKIYSTDVSQEEQVIKAIDGAFTHFGQLDYVVQSAGLNQRPRALLHDTEMANYDKVFSVNTRGLYIVQREAVKRMRGQKASQHGQKGSIVNIASISGIQPTPNLVPVSRLNVAVASFKLILNANTVCRFESSSHSDDPW